MPRHQLRLDALLALLDLKEVAATGRETLFDGLPQPAPPNRVYGGLLLAQAVVAAGRTVDGRLAPLSVQADFVRGVPVDRPIRYAVRRVFDATAMAGRAVNVIGPEGEALFSALLRFSADKPDDPSYATVGPRDVPGPETLLDLPQRFGTVQNLPAWWVMDRPVEFRHVEDPPYLKPASGPRDQQTVWFKTRGPMPADELLHAAILAYVSDMSILEPAFRMLGGTRHGGGRILSMNHSLWFHRRTDTGKWHQFDQRTPVMSHGRTLGHADVFDSSGAPIASVSQLGLVKASTETADDRSRPTKWNTTQVR